MSTSRQLLQAAYESACRQEIEALKPGNVHVFADGHDMTVQHFLDSARVSSGPLTDTTLRLGERILEAVRATRMSVGVNTNLGILLLAGPLIRAAESNAPSLRSGVASVLSRVDMEDTKAVFEAIAYAEPGGLGEAGDNDVREPPKVSLLQAMVQATDRDMIARQYVVGFADVFDVGLAELDAAERRGLTGMWPVVFAYLRFMAAFPDSHVSRKWGISVATNLRCEAAGILASLETKPDANQRLSMLADFDRKLKAEGINPGTSADLTVACLLVRSLRDNLHIPVVDD